MQQVITQIDVRPGSIQLQLCRKRLQSALIGETPSHQTTRATDIVMINLPFHLRRRGVEAKLMLTGETLSTPSQDETLVQLTRDVHRWLDNLTTGKVSSLDELAGQEGIPASEISRTLQLAFLAPDITKSILLGTHPVDLTAQSLKRLGKLPARWRVQRHLLGMPG